MEAARGALLVLVAAALAAWRPVEVFLLAFTVLGPLHYLTELAWLRRRRYFASGGATALGLTGLGGAALAAALEAGLDLPARAALQGVAVTALFVATCLGALAGLGRATPARVVAVVALSGWLGWGLGRSSWSYPYFVAFGVLLPTLVHVLAFTAMFMLSGWRRGRGGGLALGALALSLVGLASLTGEIAVPPDTLDTYDRSFGYLHRLLQGPRELPYAGTGAALLRLLAFIYLHHFLNWFDKTGRLGLLELPRRQLQGIALAWAGCVALYAWDLELGLLVVMLPNVLHVVMELPLNWQTARDLWIDVWMHG
jgi:hypothetical protein